MKISTITVLTLAGILSTGCATRMGQWAPTVDPYRDPEAININQDLMECQQLADQAAGNGLVGDTAEGIGIGALIGAAGGAAIGAVVGDPAAGAAIGAAAGGISGGVGKGFQSDDQYKNAYRSCMRQRGHKVIN